VVGAAGVGAVVDVVVEELATAGAARCRLVER
jgi:hypothetical protein